MKLAATTTLVVALLVAGCDATGNGSSELSSGTGFGAGIPSGSGATGTGVGGDGGGFIPGAGGGGGGVGGDCSGVLPATIRDFMAAPAGHPDFETFGGTMAYTGLVQQTLGGDQKPVYANAGATPQTTGPAEFAQWYNDTQGVNQAFPITLTLTETAPGQFSYDNNAFFPVDGMGFGNENNPHNFHFTTEIHTSFQYQGGEQFTFTGDDDLWLFINGQLAIDLGGLHPQLSFTLDLDASAAVLGITTGNTYAMDIFHAERHTDQSNFRIQTSISCFTPPPS